jgi:hypothetical protein
MERPRYIESNGLDTQSKCIKYRYFTSSNLKLIKTLKQNLVRKILGRNSRTLVVLLNSSKHSIKSWTKRKRSRPREITKFKKLSAKKCIETSQYTWSDGRGSNQSKKYKHFIHYEFEKLFFVVSNMIKMTHVWSHFG